MTEKNRHTLTNALRQLPDYAAPADAWREIGRSLYPTLAEQLPSYVPPADVWNAINQELVATANAGDHPVTDHPRTGKIRKLLPRLLAVAAACLLLLTAGPALWRSATDGPKVSYAHTQEVTSAGSSIDWNDPDEASFARILTEIEARDEPHLNILGLELGELTDAKEEVRAMLVAYGEDPGLVRQLAEIERDRSDVYRRIIEL